MTRIETGIIAALAGVIAAATVEIGEGTLAILITAVLVPLAAALWRERERRLSAEHKCERLHDKLAEFEEETPALHEEMLALRAEVDGLTRRAWSGGMTERYPSPSSRSTRRPITSRSRGRSRASPRGSGASSESTDECQT